MEEKQKVGTCRGGEARSLRLQGRAADLVNEKSCRVTSTLRTKKEKFLYFVLDSDNHFDYQWPLLLNLFIATTLTEGTVQHSAFYRG